MQHGLVDWAYLQFDGAGVAELLGQRNLVPLETRRSHVNGEQTVGAFPAVENARGRFESERVLPALLRHEIGDATHAIPAGADFRTVIVIDADEGVGAW